MTTATDIVVWMQERIEAERQLSTESALLVLAALEGEDALSNLDGYRPPQPASRGASSREPVGAFLSKIRVEGFRGIGEPATLELHPGPGLTVVAGRNGSGKSSFAEALEIGLTETSYRWRGKAAAWHESWRNVHHDSAPKIDITLVEESVGDTTISLRWADEADWSGAVFTLQRRGQKREAGTGSLGWSEPLESYRPLMSYDELGAILESEPSKLHDALAKVLGLEEVSEGIRLLAARVKKLSEPAAALALAKREARSIVDASSDPRKDQASRLLRSTKLDIPALGALVTGVHADDAGIVGELKRVLTVALPATGDVEIAATALTDAVGQLADAGDAVAAGLDLRADLLRTALELHAHDGDQACPLCGEGRLTPQWAEDARQGLERSDLELAGLRSAQSALSVARQRASGLLSPVPPCLAATPVADLDVEWEAARVAWRLWSVAPGADLSLADHLLAQRTKVGAVLDALHLKAREKLIAVEDAWAPVAARLGAVVAAAEDASRTHAEHDQAQAALGWLKKNEMELKNLRLEPIAERAAQIWGLLRQESNVEIAGIRLDGTTTRRRVKIDTSVDGTATSGLAVLSQGELHALALALFLPRATMPESPFRFVVLDDPVQAMDPSKVDALVAVLGEIAKTRQVVVLSHDDRLAAAVRRSQIDAHILEVTRGAKSRVSVRETKDPATRYLEDARAIVADEGLPDGTRRRVLPGILRLAAEAQARDRYFSERLSKGVPMADAESTWTAAHQTRERVALALYGEMRSLDNWLDKNPARKRGLGICTSALHGGFKGDSRLAVEDVTRLVSDIREGLR